MASLAFKIASNMAVSVFFRVLASGAALIGVGLMARSLGQHGFGDYATITAYLSIFVIFADLGLHSLMLREISRHDGETDKIASNFFTLRLASSLVFLVFGFAASFLLPYSLIIKIGIGAGAVGFFFLSSSQLLLAIFQKNLSMHLSAYADISGRALQLFLIYAVYLGASNVLPEGKLILFVGAMSVASFLIFLLYFIFSRRYVRLALRIDFEYWKKILKNTWPIALSIVLTLIYFKIDTIFLSLMKSSSDVGVYGIAYKALESLIFFPAMFAGLVMPTLSRFASSDAQEFKKVLGVSLRVMSIAAFPVVVGGILLSYSAANFIGGRDFLASGAPMQALFIATGIIFFGNVLGRAIIALNLQKKAVVFYLVGVVLNIVLNAIFIPQYTYMGAAWTTVATELFVAAGLFALVYKKTGAALMGLSEIIKPAFSAGFMGITLYFLIPDISAPLSAFHFFILVILGIAIYFVALCAIRGLSLREIKALAGS